MEAGLREYGCTVPEVRAAERRCLSRVQALSAWCQSSECVCVCVCVCVVCVCVCVCVCALSCFWCALA